MCQNEVKSIEGKERPSLWKVRKDLIKAIILELDYKEFLPGN